jgi:hypothetical protein
MRKTDKRQPAPQLGLLQADQRTSSAIRDKLGEQLRAMYGKPEEAPLTDDLLHLVRQLSQPCYRGKP